MNLFNGQLNNKKYLFFNAFSGGSKSTDAINNKLTNY